MNVFFEKTKAAVRAMENEVIPAIKKTGISDIEHESNSFTCRVKIYDDYHASFSTIKFIDWSVEPGSCPIEIALMKNSIDKIIYIEEAGYNDVQVFESPE